MATRRLHVAKRLDHVGFSDIVQIRNQVLELREQGLPVHAFCGGEPFFETPEPIKYAAVHALTHHHTVTPPLPASCRSVSSSRKSSAPRTASTQQWRMCWSPRAARTRCLSWWPQSHE